MENKTAMQELIEWARKYNVIDAYDTIQKAKQLLEKEEKNMNEAYRKGVEDERYNKVNFIEKPYYKETFKIED